MNSLWHNTAEIPRHGALKGDIKTDVLIIGGGLAGILCAYALKKAGVDCVVAETQRVGGGTTGNTTAKITSQHGLVYDKLIKEYGVEKAQMYLSANEWAVRQYRELCRGIDCGFEDKDNFVYSLDDRKKLEKELNALSRLGFDAEFVGKVPLPFHTEGAVKFKDQAQFNPLEFINEISKDLKIYENTKVIEIIGGAAITQNGRIYAKNFVVATHFPFINKHGGYFIKMYQHRSYVITYENAPNVGGMYVDENDKGKSFRNYGDLLLIGGGGHRTGKQGGGWQEIRTFALRSFPAAKEKYHWAAQDCMTLDGAPYIGRYSKSTPNLYVATGFNKWGMTGSMVAAKILTDKLLGRQNDFESVFEPTRSIIHPQLALNLGESLLGMITPVPKRCPHLGCALKWNSEEHSWDCPCHGSRFSKNGELLNNPATEGLKK